MAVRVLVALAEDLGSWLIEDLAAHKHLYPQVQIRKPPLTSVGARHASAR